MMTLIRKESVNITNFSNKTSTNNINHGETTAYALLLVITIITLCYILHHLRKKCKK